MQRSFSGFALICSLFTLPPLVAGSVGYGNGITFESENGEHTLNSGARVQVRFTQDDPDQGDSKGSFDIRRAELWLKGKLYEHWKHKLQVVFSSDQETGVDVDQGPPVTVDVESPESAELQDAYFIYTRHNMAQLWIGQGKVLFGRQQLTSSGKQQFVDRTLTLRGFEAVRSQGVALIGLTENKRWEYNFGVYDDLRGQNIRDNSDDHYMTTARVVFTPFGEYKLDESPHDYPDDPKLAVGIKALRDTVEDETGVDTDNEIYGVELAFKRRGLSIVSEYFTRTLDTPGQPEMDTDAGYLQVGWLFPNKKAEIAGRYAMLSPDVAGPSQDLEETGVAFSWYFNKHNYKVQADLRDIRDDADSTNDVTVTRVQLQFVF